MKPQKRKKILIVCQSPKGTNPGQRLKYEQYIPALEKAGYDITISSFQSQRFWDIIYQEGRVLEKIFWTLVGYGRRTLDLLRLPFYDGLYIYMAVTPLGPPIFERLFVTLNRKVIFDIEDMAFITDTSKANRWIAKIKGTKKYEYLSRKAKFVITSSLGLSDKVNEFNKNNEAITATFDTNRFVPSGSYIQNDPIVIGWTGSHSTIKYLYLLDDVFKELATKRPIKIRVIANATYSCEGVEVENVTWTEANEITDLQKIDIGVYPVPIEPWVLGKSGCKTITYMSVGLPSVSTAYGNAKSLVVTDGVDGYLALEHQEWIDKLIHLIDHPEERERMGKEARKTAVERFSVEANTNRYLKLFNKIY